ncbi:MAG TPA: tetratricopeptide repeat protein [Candidatus Polarisedimenticolia bacterium]|nr:tetratricopeptide repeat protein [Candidatus Polarisedimenticolia bacterium]
MWLLALLTIAVPAALVPFQLRPENACGASATRSETAVVVTSTNPLWDESLDSPRFLNPGATAPTFSSRASVSIPDESAIESSEPAPDGLDLARNLNSLGVAAWERGDLVKAEEYHRQALEIRQRLAPGSLDLAESYNHLGDVEQELGHLATAEKYENNALAIREGLAPDSLAVAETLHSLGRVTMDRGDLAKAEEYYRRSLDLSLKLAPGSRDLALSFIGLANLCGHRGDLTGQEEYLHQASRLEGELTPADRATILQGLGGAYLQRGQPQKAEEYFRQALEIRQKFLPDSLALAISLSRMGDLNANRGDPEQAERYFRQALEIRQTVAPGSLVVATSLSNIGSVVQILGNWAQAEKYFRQALAIQQQLAPASLPVAGSLHSLGIISWLRGDLPDAEDNFRRALDIRRRLAPGGAVMAQTLNWLGLASARRGDLDRAEEYDHQALDISEKLSSASLLDAELLSNLGDIAKRRANLTQADTYYHQALAIQHKIAPDSPTEAGTLQKLGELDRNRQGFAEAEKYFRQALAIREQKIPGSLSHAHVLLALASLLRQRNQMDASSRLYGQAIGMLDNQMTHLGGSDDVRSTFRAEYESKYQDYIDLLVTQRKPELAFDVVERSRARTLLELLQRAQIDLRRGGDPELLQRERSLRESISAKSSYRLQLLDAGNAGDELAEIDRQTRELRDQYDDVKTQLRIDSPGYSALMQPKPLTVEEVQRQLLDENTVLLEYSLGERRSYVWAVTPTSAAVFALPPRKTIEDAARNAYELLTARGRRIDKETIPERKSRLAQAEAEYTKVATELSQMILGPVAASLEKKRLLIVSDGALQYLPYAALPSPSLPASASGKSAEPSPGLKREEIVPLIARHEIVSLPSASALAELRRANTNRKEPPKAVAVLADPVFDRRDERVAASHVGIRRAKQKVMDSPPPDDGSAQRLTRSATDVGLIKGRLYLSRLLWTQREAAAILNVTPAGQGMQVLGFEANRATAISPALAQYRVVHFATHALLDSKNPELSGLVLSLVDKRGQPQNGFLDLDQIYNLNLPVDLVVLSACDTGLGKEIRGEGLIGLSRGFMYAGATRVMASLWSVDDEVTSELMARFYKSLEQNKMSPATALQAAQIEVAKEERWSSPYYWAGFQIQGEWK